jgi:hypothetical protein
LDDVIERLLGSREPAVRYKVLTKVLDREPGMDLREEIRESPTVKRLLSERDEDGMIPFHPYAKWYGAHWVLADLADIGYPPGDETLIPLREQVYGWLFGKSHEAGARQVRGRVRTHASMEGNTLYYLIALGLTDARIEELADRLIRWQWPDGGWNCDKNPSAANSSFMESLIPLRALALHARFAGDDRSWAAAERAAEVFLERRLYRRRRDGNVISDDFVRLHYPCYWHYDILFGMKVFAETGFIRDERCEDALRVLESKRLPDGSFPAEKRYYRLTEKPASGRSLVDWGGVSRRRANEFVTVDALYVLKESGRRAT